MAFTGITALVSAASTGAAVTATMVMAAVAEVGLALTVVGAVTGNEKLTKIGGAMSLIGGVGGMIAGAAGGAAGAAAAEAGLGEAATTAALETASAEAAAAYGGTAGAEAATAELVSGMEAAASTGADLATTAASSAPQGIVESAIKPIETAAQPAQSMQVAQQPAQTVNDISTPQAPRAPEAPAGAQGPSTPYEAPDMVAGENPTDRALRMGTKTANLPPQDSNSFFSGMTNWLSKNQNMAGGLFQGAWKGYEANRKHATDQRYLDQRQVALDRGNQVARFQPRSIVQGAMA